MWIHKSPAGAAGPAHDLSTNQVRDVGYSTATQKNQNCTQEGHSDMLSPRINSTGGASALMTRISRMACPQPVMKSYITKWDSFLFLHIITQEPYAVSIKTIYNLVKRKKILLCNHISLPLRDYYMPDTPTYFK